MRAAHLGPNWDVAKVRGTPHNTGEVLRAALAHGAQAYGHWSGCHAIQWDADAPPTGDREITNRFSRQSYPVGIVVNRRGERFLDEGEDFRNYTYAKFGAEVLRQPEGIAAQVFDAKTVGLLRTIDYEAPGAARVDADTLGELADGLGIDRAGFERTVAAFNEASAGEHAFDPSVKDGRGTVGISPPKSNWAQPIDTPPYVGFRITCGITFTFGGVRVDDQAPRPRRRRARDPRPVRRGRARRRTVLPQLPGRLGADGGRGVRPPRRLRGRRARVGVAPGPVHPDEVAVDAATVARLVAAQFPQWARCRSGPCPRPGPSTRSSGSVTSSARACRGWRRGCPTSSASALAAAARAPDLAADPGGGGPRHARRGVSLPMGGRPLDPGRALRRRRGRRRGRRGRGARGLRARAPRDPGRRRPRPRAGGRSTSSTR
jgi:hypothetical protein